MIRLVLAMTMIWLPAALWAKPALVQSGEHPGFTRLAVILPHPAGWTLEKSTKGYVLSMDDPEMEFDTGAAFRKITRERISGLVADADSGNLTIETACACVAEAFSLGHNIVVIDVRNETPGLRGSKGPVRIGQAPDPLEIWRAGNRQRLAPNPPRQPSSNFPPLALPSRASQPSTDLFHAVADGIATGALTRPERYSRPDTAPKAVQGDMLGHIRVVGDDAARPDPDATRGEDGDGSPFCLPALLRKIRTWKPAAEPLKSSALVERTALLSDSGQAADAALTIARQYLYLGLPQEALLLLNQAVEDSAETQALVALAHLIAKDELAHGAGRAGAACELPDRADDPQNWPDKTATRSREAEIVSAYLDLPSHLKSPLFGPVMALLGDGTAQGHDVARATALRAYASTTGTDQTEIALQSPLLIDRLARDTLEHYGSRRTGLEYAARLELLDRQSARGDVNQHRNLQDLDYLEAPLRLTAAHRSLLDAVARAKALQGDFDWAFANAPQDRSTRSFIWGQLSETDADADLLRYAMAATSAEIFDIPSATRILISDRLGDLGFVAASRQWSIGP